MLYLEVVCCVQDQEKMRDDQVDHCSVIAQQNGFGGVKDVVRTMVETKQALLDQRDLKLKVWTLLRWGWTASLGDHLSAMAVALCWLKAWTCPS